MGCIWTGASPSTTYRAKVSNAPGTRCHSPSSVRPLPPKARSAGRRNATKAKDTAQNGNERSSACRHSARAWDTPGQDPKRSLARSRRGRTIAGSLESRANPYSANAARPHALHPPRGIQRRYASIDPRTKSARRSSCRPDTQATASMCTGCSAKRMPATTATPPLQLRERTSTMTNIVTAAWSRILVK